MPTRPPRLRPFALAAVLLPAGLAAVELGVRAADSYWGGALSRPPCPAAATVPDPLARHALPAFGAVPAADPDSGERRTLRVNSAGLRGADPPIPKPPGVRRVLTLGDEAAFAAGVPGERTFCGLLTPVLSDAAARAEPGSTARVVNAAAPGDCPLLSVLRLRRLGALQPDLILLCVRPSDLAQDARYRRDLLTDDAGRPLACPHPSFSKGEPRSAGGAWWRRSLAVRVAGRSLAGPGGCPPGGAAAAGPAAAPRDALAAEQALAPLADLRRIADGWGVRAAVVLLPDGPAAPDPAAVALIRDAAAAAGLRVCDATALLTGEAADPGPRITPRGALTRAGHAALAAELSRFLLAAPGGE